MKIIGFTGLAGSGKDAAASFIADKNSFCMSFAGAIRRMLEEGLHIDMPSSGIAKENVIPHVGASPRRLMQTLADWGRAIHPDFWIRILLRDIKDTIEFEESTGGVNQNFIITDVRYNNEAIALRDMGATIIRIVRPNAVPVERHSSELGIAAHLIDFTVINDSTKDVFSDRLHAAFNLIGTP